MPPILDTARLCLRPFSEADAPFVLELVNDADWLTYIGDKAVRTLDDAKRYLLEGPMAMNAELGIGLCAMDLKSPERRPLGMCGLLVREGSPDVELGYALLPEARGQGLVREAAQAWVHHGFQTLNLRSIHAYTHAENTSSHAVLASLGFELLAPSAEAEPGATRHHWLLRPDAA
ncbi:MAG: GNAT family N-acetyltransferase [Hydrogenophaga sp.]|uniref:GNAT family N-acetyltransferase n=1 Tax=Hydrogenophaga sp. TaxID=1904254 RepID=UPI003D0DDA84